MGYELRVRGRSRDANDLRQMWVQSFRLAGLVVDLPRGLDMYGHRGPIPIKMTVTPALALPIIDEADLRREKMQGRLHMAVKTLTAAAAAVSRPDIEGITPDEDVIEALFTIDESAGPGDRLAGWIAAIAFAIAVDGKVTDPQTQEVLDPTDALAQSETILRDRLGIAPD